MHLLLQHRIKSAALSTCMLPRQYVLYMLIREKQSDCGRSGCIYLQSALAHVAAQALFHEHKLECNNRDLSTGNKYNAG